MILLLTLSTSDGGAMVIGGLNLDFETFDLNSQQWTKQGTMDNVIEFKTFRKRFN